jgi:hypothetical protein
VTIWQIKIFYDSLRDNKKGKLNERGEDKNKKDNTLWITPKFVEIPGKASQ